MIQAGAGPNMNNAIDLSIVVPCLNEEKTVVGTLDTLIAALQTLTYSYEVLVIDDGSIDGTARAVETYISAHPALPIHFHRHPRNRGLSRTYVDGAFLGRGKYYRLVCADNVEPQETLVAVFRRLGEAEMIIPYHDPVLGKPLLRRALSRIYTFLVNTLTGHKIHYYNGLALHLRYNVMRWGPYSFGFGFQAELITRLLDEGATYIEIPVLNRHMEKSGRNSALNLMNFLSVGHTLLEMSIRRIRKSIFQK